MEVFLTTAEMRARAIPPQRLSRGRAADLYWTFAQMVAHHSVNGCKLQAGDLFGTGTLSGPQPGQLGSLLEMTEGGKHPIELPNGETRTFLEAGDEVILKARCRKEGEVSIGFGECRGVVVG